MSKYADKMVIMEENIPLRDVDAQSKISKMNSDIYKTELVILGDSYTQGYLAGGTFASPNMSEQIASGLGLNLHNYGVSASAYTFPTNNIAEQATNAINDTSYDHSKVKYIIIIAGINDVNLGDHAAVISASQAVQTMLTSAFPNATLVLAPCWGATSLIDSSEKVFRDICTPINAAGARIVSLYKNITTLSGWRSLMGSDSIHPTVEGYGVLAKQIVAMLNGGWNPRGKKITSITPGANWDLSGLSIYRTEDSIRFFGLVEATATITDTSIPICTFDPDACFIGNFFQPVASTFGWVNIWGVDGVNLTSAPVDGSLKVLNNSGTINAGDRITFNFEIPILNY